MSTFTELLLLFLVVRLYALVSVSTRNLMVFYKASMCPYRFSLSDVGDVHKLSLNILPLQCSMWFCHIWSPVRVMNRIVRRRSVAVPWCLFPRDLSIGQVLCLSSLWRGHWLYAMGCSLCFQSVGLKGWLFDANLFLCVCKVCRCLLLAGISCSVRDAIRWWSVSCWGLEPPFLCLKSASLLFLMNVSASR